MRIIYDNYDLEERYSDDEIREIAIEREWVDSEDEITEAMLWKIRYEEDDINFETVKEELINFFGDDDVLFIGTVGLWHGTYDGGDIDKFDTLFYKAIADCNYLKIYEDKGHLYLMSSHHDGTNHFEIKRVTQEGSDYYDRWNYGYDSRTKKYVHKAIYKRYSRLPRYCKTLYGC